MNSRRQILLAGLSLLVAGCASPTASRQSQSPTANWPGSSSQPRQSRGRDVGPRSRSTRHTTARLDPLTGARPRSLWTDAAPVRSRVNPMNGVNRITLHHEGGTPLDFTSEELTRRRLESVRNNHVSGRGWGDIGYHYIIDRAGRVWEGRPTEYQGAHVRGNNEHNLGIVLLGNFDQQSPASAQIQAMQNLVSHLMQRHNVPTSRLYTHQELAPSACPGRNLQPRIASLRSAGRFG